MSTQQLDIYRRLQRAALLLLALDVLSTRGLAPAPSVLEVVPPPPPSLGAPQASLSLPQQMQGTVGVMTANQQQPVPTAVQDTTALPATPIIAFPQATSLRQQLPTEGPPKSGGGLPYYAVVLIVIGSLVIATIIFYIWTSVRSKSAASRIHALFKGARKHRSRSTAAKSRRMTYRERLHSHQRYGRLLTPPGVESDSDRSSQHHHHKNSRSDGEHSHHHHHHHGSRHPSLHSGGVPESYTSNSSYVDAKQGIYSALVQWRSWVRDSGGRTTPLRVNYSTPQHPYSVAEGTTGSPPSLHLWHDNLIW